MPPSMARKSKAFQPTLGTTPYPNFLLDRVMPRLTDTQWRLLSVIVRQTFGWDGGDGTRKKTDWLSHAQLKRKTGRSSAALSLAIATLVRACLIVVQDSRGGELGTPALRRRAHSPLTFAVNPQITSAAFQRAFGQARFQYSQSGNNKRNLYKRKQQQTRLPSRLKPPRPPFHG